MMQQLHTAHLDACQGSWVFTQGFQFHVQFIHLFTFPVFMFASCVLLVQLFSAFFSPVPNHHNLPVYLNPRFLSVQRRVIDVDINVVYLCSIQPVILCSVHLLMIINTSLHLPVSPAFASSFSHPHGNH